MLCKTGSSILAQGVVENIAQSTTPQHSIKSKADTVHTLVNMPDIHLLCMILSNFHRLSCLFYWCDSFETWHAYYWYTGRPIEGISQFMKMKPEYHFKYAYWLLHLFQSVKFYMREINCTIIALKMKWSHLLKPGIKMMHSLTELPRN